MTKPERGESHSSASEAHGLGHRHYFLPRKRGDVNPSGEKLSNYKALRLLSLK